MCYSCLSKSKAYILTIYRYTQFSRTLSPPPYPKDLRQTKSVHTITVLWTSQQTT